jgi:hypothetical protein
VAEKPLGYYPKAGYALAAGKASILLWGTGLNAFPQISPPTSIDFYEVSSKLVPISPEIFFVASSYYFA